MEILMTVLGVLTHFLKKLLNLKKSGNEVSPLEYWKLYPYQTTMSLVGAVVGYFFLVEAGQLSIATAYAIGYMSDSVSDVVGERGFKKI